MILYDYLMFAFIPPLKMVGFPAHDIVKRLRWVV